MAEPTAVVVAAMRTATGKFLGGLSSFTAPQLGAIVIKEAVRRSGIEPNTIDEVIMGNVVISKFSSAAIANGIILRRKLHVGKCANWASISSDQ